MLNASPDARQQLLQNQCLWPRKGLRDSPDRLRSSLARVALERMKLNAEDLVAQAQEFQPLPLTRDRASGEEGLRDVRLLMSIYESARTGRAVKVAA